MAVPILTTKLYIPPPRPQVVLRPRLLAQLTAGLNHKLTLISAPAGFGKTTLISEWVNHRQRPVAWLSLDEQDSDPQRFITYFVAALRTIDPEVGQAVFGLLQSPQPPTPEAVLTTLLNEIASISTNFILVLDDYHLLESQAIDQALTFLIEHLPPQMHLVMTTREDPNLPLPRLRVRRQLTELRAADLRFTPNEAADFLNQAMGLNLTADEVNALETRTEGWIAGLQLAALALQSMATTQSQQDIADFIQSFSGSHRFVLDYLVEEVLHQQTPAMQTFLLRTSILERLCGPLCEAVLGNSQTAGQEILERMEQTNLFIVPLDNERRWYRYHHLFADLLRQRLNQSIESENESIDIVDLHLRASHWYEENNLELEAFHHATAANDIERAAYLMAGKGMPLHFRGAVGPVLNWLKSLPQTVLDAKPTLWVMYASALSMTGQLAGVEEKLQAAEAALENAPVNDKTRNLIGHIAAIRALLAASQLHVEAIIEQSQRALAYLHPNNLPVRTATTWKLGFAYQLQGDRTAAIQAYREAIATSEATGNTIINLAATLNLGRVQELQNQLHLAAESYQRVLQLVGEKTQPSMSDAHLGLARLCYEWNDLERAQQHAEQGIQTAQQIRNIDRVAASQVFLAQIKLAQGDTDEAAAFLAKAEQVIHQYNFVAEFLELAAVQILLQLRLGNLQAAVQLAQQHKLPLSQARLLLVQGDVEGASTLLETVGAQAAEKDFQDQRLKLLVLQAAVAHAQNNYNQAMHQLSQALTLAEPHGFIRTFVDEGQPIAELLNMMKSRNHGSQGYIGKLLEAFKTEDIHPSTLTLQPLIDPLSERELEVLRLIAQGLSNKEISDQLFLALSTVKGHNRNIYDKLQVQRRTEAVLRGRELGLL